MRRWIPIVGFLGLGAAAAVAVAIAVQETSPGTVVAKAPAPGTERLLLAVEKLTCGSCETRIRTALQALPAVRGVGVDLGRRTVTVEYDPKAVDPRSLAAAVTRAGYPARFLALGAGVPAPGRASPNRGAGCGGSCCPS